MKPKQTLCVFAALIFCLALLSSCGYDKSNQTTVMKIGGENVSAELYHYVYMKNVGVRFGEGADFQKLTAEERSLVREDTEAELRKFFAVESLAKKEGVSLNEVELEKIAGEMKALKASYDSEREYKAFYYRQSMTENVFYREVVNYYLECALAEHYSEKITPTLDDETVRKDVDAYFYSAMQIYLSGEDAEERMNAIKKQIDAGASFADMAAKHSRDGSKIRCFTEGELHAFFEDTVKSLKIGEISEVVVSDLGAHLILRLPHDPEYVTAHLGDLRESDFARIYNGILLEEANSFTVETFSLPD